MLEQREVHVRKQARRLGMTLIRLPAQPQLGSAAPSYQLVVPDLGVRIYPQGSGHEWAPLHDVEDWLSFPWE